MPDRLTRPQFAKFFAQNHPEAFPDGAKPEDYDIDELVDGALATFPEYAEKVQTREDRQAQLRMEWPMATPPAAQPELAAQMTKKLDTAAPRFDAQAAISNAAGPLKALVGGATAGVSYQFPQAVPKGPARDAFQGMLVPTPEQEANPLTQAGALAGGLGTNLALAYTMGPAGPAGYAAVAETMRQTGQMQAGQRESLSPMGIAGQAALGYGTAALPGALGTTGLTKLATGVGLGAVTGAAPLLTQQVTDTGTINWNDPELAKWAAAGGLIGGALSPMSGPRGVAPAPKPKPQVDPAAPPVDLTQLPHQVGGRYYNGATGFNYTVKGIQPHPTNPLMAVELADGSVTIRSARDWDASVDRVLSLPQAEAQAPVITPEAAPLAPVAQARPAARPDVIADTPEAIQLELNRLAAERGEPMPAPLEVKTSGNNFKARGTPYVDPRVMEPNPVAPDGGLPPTVRPTAAPAQAELPLGAPDPVGGAPGRPLNVRQDSGFIKPELQAALTGGTVGALTGAAAAPEDDRIRFGLAGGLAGATAATAGYGALQALQPNRLGDIKQAHASPVVSEHLKPNTARAVIGATLKGEFTRLKNTVGKSFETYHELKKFGTRFVGGIQRFRQFNNTLYEIPQWVRRDIEGVLTGLKDPSDYRHMQDIVRLRRSIELMGRPNTPKNAQGIPVTPEWSTPQGGQRARMTLPEAQVSLQNLEALAAKDAPQVLQAADLARQTMQRIGAEANLFGFLDPKVLADNPDYFPDYVMDYVFGVYNTPSAPAPAVRPGKQGYRKQWTGHRAGEGTTLRDYTQVVTRRLMDHYADMEKAKMITDLGKMYDPRFNGTVPPGQQLNTPPTGYEWFTFNPMEKAKNVLTPNGAVNPRLTYMLPKELAAELTARLAPINPALQVVQRWTGKWKGLVIRGQGPVFALKNFLGDHAALYQSYSPLEWASVAGHELQAIGELVARARGQQTQAQYLARGQAAGIGASAAAAEVTKQVMASPVIRKVARNLDGSPAAQALEGAKAAVQDVWHSAGALNNATREWGETIPRLTMFIHELAKGRVDADAGAITAHALIDYQDLTPFEKNILRGFLAPFYTWNKKTFQAYVPGAGKDHLGSRGGQAQKAMRRIATAAGGAGAFALWNEQMYPEEAHNMAPFLQDQPFIIVPNPFDPMLPDGRMPLIYLTMSGPANAAARMVGLGGAPQRAVKLAKGSTTLTDEVKRSGNQIRESWAGMAGPIAALPYTILTGRDLRTGREISHPDADFAERTKDKAAAIVTSVPPFSVWMRASLEGRNPNESMIAYTKRAVFGSLGGRVDRDKNRLASIQSDIAEVMSENQEQQRGIRRDTIMNDKELLGYLQRKDGKVVVPTVALFKLLGPTNSLRAYELAKLAKDDGKAFADAAGEVARELMQSESRVTWEIPYRLMSVGQSVDGLNYQHLDEVAQKMQQREKGSKPLF